MILTGFIFFSNNFIKNIPEDCRKTIGTLAVIFFEFIYQTVKIGRIDSRIIDDEFLLEKNCSFLIKIDKKKN